MPPAVFSTNSVNQLRRFMQHTLCEHERFDPEQVLVKQSYMRKQGEVLGLVVRVESIKRTRCHAIWAEREHRVLFYDSAGHRFAEVKLAEAPVLEGLLAA